MSTESCTPQIVLLTGWQYEGHDSKYPSWEGVNKHLKRDCDETALDSLRWLIREARQYNCLATLHINMFDAYEDSPLFDAYAAKDILARDQDGKLRMTGREVLNIRGHVLNPVGIYLRKASRWTITATITVDDWEIPSRNP
jgi:hypothetical protein